MPPWFVAKVAVSACSASHDAFAFVIADWAFFAFFETHLPNAFDFVALVPYAVAKSVASELAIDQVFAEVLPDQKASKIEELKRGGKRVAMVGDGVNDAPGLVTAERR